MLKLLALSKGILTTMGSVFLPTSPTILELGAIWKTSKSFLKRKDFLSKHLLKFVHQKEETKRKLLQFLFKICNYNRVATRMKWRNDFVYILSS